MVHRKEQPLERREGGEDTQGRQAVKSYTPRQTSGSCDPEAKGERSMSQGYQVRCPYGSAGRYDCTFL